MESKKVAKSVEHYTAKGAFHYLEEVKAEFKKVSWTGRDELRVYTKIVVAVTFILGMAVYVADLFIQSSLAGVNAAIRMVVG